MKFLYCAGIYLFLALSCDLIASKKKGPTKCGDVFHQTTATIQNNTLHPDTQCVYHITPINGTQNIRLFLKKLLLDGEDSVTVTEANETEPLFPAFHGQEVAVPLITNSKNLTITINVSSVSNIVRHFEAFYDSIAVECIFKVDDDMLLTQQPLTPVNTTTECKLQYILEANVARALSFETFNLSSSSTVTASEVENSGSFSGTNRPPDFYSFQQATFDAKISAGDSFLLRQYKLNSACSHYLSVTGSTTIKTPEDLPKLNNGSLLLECRWLLVNAGGLALQFTLKSINLTDPYDVLLIADGPHFNSPVLHQITSSTQLQASDTVVITSGAALTVSFKTLSIHSSFVAEVKLAGQGKYIENNGTLMMKNTEDSIWLLQTEPDKNVVLQFHTSPFTSPSTVDIFAGFSMKSKLITSLHGNIWYPILSTTSKMMVVATDFKQGSFEADFSGSAVGCMYMSQGSSDTYTLSKNCNSTCAWIIPPINSSGTDLLLDLQFISLEDGDLIEVLQLDTKASLATVKPGTTHIPQLNVKSELGAYVNITRGACPKKPNDIILVAQANYIPECLRKVTLVKDQQIELTSPGFPNTYPLFENCQWVLTTSPPKQLIHVAFDKFRLAPNHCMIFSENGSSPMKYDGDHLPADLFFTNDVIVEFNSGKCDPSMKSLLVSDQGFLANVTSTMCGKVFTGSTGLFSSAVNESLCIWQISLPPPTEKESASVIIFTVTQKDRTGNFHLDIHDGNSTRDAVIENGTNSELWSRTNTLTIIYRKLDPSKPATEVEFNYTTKICGKLDQCHNGICLHPDWRCNGKNNCGDFTDEIECGSVPVPATTAAPPPAGTSSTTFGVTVFFMFILGGVLAIIVPLMYKRVRNAQYSQFRDVSVIE